MNLSLPDPVNQAEVPTLTEEEWLEKGHELYGEDREKWEFVCPLCGHVQSAESMIENNPGMDEGDIYRTVNQNCESRFNNSVQCRWRLGFIKYYFGIVVKTDEGQYKSFAFADMDTDTEPIEGRNLHVIE